MGVGDGFTSLLWGLKFYSRDEFEMSTINNEESMQISYETWKICLGPSSTGLEMNVLSNYN